MAVLRRGFSSVNPCLRVAATVGSQLQKSAPENIVTFLKLWRNPKSVMSDWTENAFSWKIKNLANKRKKGIAEEKGFSLKKRFCQAIELKNASRILCRSEA